MVGIELSSLLTGFRVITSGHGVIELTRETIKQCPPEYGRIYDKVRSLMANRSVLDEASIFEMKQNDQKDKSAPVESPIVRGLSNLYAANFGVVYIMYAPPGQGKSFGARAFLKNYYQFDEDENVKGFMMSGDGIADEDYMSSLGNALGVKNEVEGWVHALLLAMDEPIGCQPSILILDDFNSLGKEDVNKAFVKKLYGALEGKKNMYVVLMVSDKSLASKICSINNGQRVRPLPHTYTGEPTSPEWNGMKWKREELIGAVKYAYPNDFPEPVPNPKFDFVVDGMTPLQAVLAAQGKTREVKIPGSPKKKSVL